MKISSILWIVRRETIFVFIAFVFAGPVPLKADIVERSYSDPKGEKKVTGYVFQGSRNMKRQGKKRSTASSVILPPLSLEALSKPGPETVVADPESSPAAKGNPKPRFGYGSDYRPVQQNPNAAPKVSATTTTSTVRFRTVPRLREYYPLLPYYGYTARPYFYRPGSIAGGHYLHSPGCYTGAVSAGTRVNVYHGGNLTFSSWNPIFGYRYYR